MRVRAEQMLCGQRLPPRVPDQRRDGARVFGRGRRIASTRATAPMGTYECALGFFLDDNYSTLGLR